MGRAVLVLVGILGASASPMIAKTQPEPSDISTTDLMRALHLTQPPLPHVGSSSTFPGHTPEVGHTRHGATSDSFGAMSLHKATPNETPVDRKMPDLTGSNVKVALEAALLEILEKKKKALELQRECVVETMQDRQRGSKDYGIKNWPGNLKDTLNGENLVPSSMKLHFLLSERVIQLCSIQDAIQEALLKLTGERTPEWKLRGDIQSCSAKYTWPSQPVLESRTKRSSQSSLLNDAAEGNASMPRKRQKPMAFNHDQHEVETSARMNEHKFAKLMIEGGNSMQKLDAALKLQKSAESMTEQLWQHSLKLSRSDAMRNLSRMLQSAYMQLISSERSTDMTKTSAKELLHQETLIVSNLLVGLPTMEERAKIQQSAIDLAKNIANIRVLLRSAGHWYLVPKLDISPKNQQPAKFFKGDAHTKRGLRKRMVSAKNATKSAKPQQVPLLPLGQTHDLLRDLRNRVDSLEDDLLNQQAEIASWDNYETTTKRRMRRVRAHIMLYDDEDPDWPEMMKDFNDLWRTIKESFAARQIERDRMMQNLSQIRERFEREKSRLVELWSKTVRESHRDYSPSSSSQQSSVTPPKQIVRKSELQKRGSSEEEDEVTARRVYKMIEEAEDGMGQLNSADRDEGLEPLQELTIKELTQLTQEGPLLDSHNSSLQSADIKAKINVVRKNDRLLRQALGEKMASLQRNLSALLPSKIHFLRQLIMLDSTPESREESTSCLALLNKIENDTEEYHVVKIDMDNIILDRSQDLVGQLKLLILPSDEEQEGPPPLTTSLESEQEGPIERNAAAHVTRVVEDSARLDPDTERVLEIVKALVLQHKEQSTYDSILRSCTFSRSKREKLNARKIASELDSALAERDIDEFLMSEPKPVQDVPMPDDSQHPLDSQALKSEEASHS